MLAQFLGDGCLREQPCLFRFGGATFWNYFLLDSQGTGVIAPLVCQIL